MTAEGKSFYIGIGRSGRASDRVRYVKYLMQREASGRHVKWVLSNIVIAKLIRAGLKIEPKILRRDLTRPRALVEERRVITWFQQRGVVLANQQHNGGSAVSAAKVIRDLRRRVSGARPK